MLNPECVDPGKVLVFDLHVHLCLHISLELPAIISHLLIVTLLINFGSSKVTII